MDDYTDMRGEVTCGPKEPADISVLEIFPRFSNVLLHFTGFKVVILPSNSFKHHYIQ